MQRLRTTLVIAVTVILSTGCTVPPAGLAGVGVDSDRNLVGYLHVCHDHIDGATLFYDAGSTDETSKTADAGAWQATSPITGTAIWSLSEPGDKWTVITPVDDLVPEREYTLYGWTNDNSWSADAVTFTLAEVGRLDPGQVLHWSGRSEGELNEISSLSEFESRACELIGS